MTLEVDLEYPKDLHDMHDNYTLATEKINATKNMLSPYSEQISQKWYNITIGQHGKQTDSYSIQQRKTYITVQKSSIVHRSRIKSRKGTQNVRIQSVMVKTLY